MLKWIFIGHDRRKFSLQVTLYQISYHANRYTGGGHTTPELVSAASNADGLGVLGAVRMNPNNYSKQ